MPSTTSNTCSQRFYCHTAGERSGKFWGHTLQVHIYHVDHLALTILAECWCSLVRSSKVCDTGHGHPDCYKLVSKHIADQLGTSTVPFRNMRIVGKLVFIWEFIKPVLMSRNTAALSQTTCKCVRVRRFLKAFPVGQKVICQLEYSLVAFWDVSPCLVALHGVSVSHTTAGRILV